MLALDIDDLDVSFPGLPVPALAVDRLHVVAGEHVAVTGPSGSGKSTLVNIVTGLERPRRGTIRWASTDIAALGEGARDRWRAENVGLVLQDFHLFDGLSAIENVLLPVRLRMKAVAPFRERAAMLMNRVGLARPDQNIRTMSRGEMQRVAVARALLRRPGVIVADEPTASLDPENGAAVADLLVELAGEVGATLLVISHDERLIGRMPRRIRLAAGRIVADSAQMGEAA
jgi:putative ABC transport system ATP-binding protein